MRTTQCAFRNCGCEVRESSGGSEVALAGGERCSSRHTSSDIKASTLALAKLPERSKRSQWRLINQTESREDSRLADGHGTTRAGVGSMRSTRSKMNRARSLPKEQLAIGNPDKSRLMFGGQSAILSLGIRSSAPRSRTKPVVSRSDRSRDLAHVVQWYWAAQAKSSDIFLLASIRGRCSGAPREGTRGGEEALALGI